MSTGTDISALYHEFTDALTEILAENAVGPARRGRLARARAAVKKHPEYSEHAYFFGGGDRIQKLGRHAKRRSLRRALAVDNTAAKTLPVHGRDLGRHHARSLSLALQCRTSSHRRSPLQGRTHYGRAACCCSAKMAWNMASSTSASSVQLAGSMKGLGAPSLSLANFSCMLYWAP
jgi:hypothetical protein